MYTLKFFFFSQKKLTFDTSEKNVMQERDCKFLHQISQPICSFPEQQNEQPVSYLSKRNLVNGILGKVH